MRSMEDPDKRMSHRRLGMAALLPVTYIDSPSASDRSALLADSSRTPNGRMGLTASEQSNREACLNYGLG
jgi:hypothetical protein